MSSSSLRHSCNCCCHSTNPAGELLNWVEKRTNDTSLTAEDGRPDQPGSLLAAAHRRPFGPRCCHCHEQTRDQSGHSSDPQGEGIIGSHNHKVGSDVQHQQCMEWYPGATSHGIGECSRGLRYGDQGRVDIIPPASMETNHRPAGTDDKRRVDYSYVLDLNLPPNEEQPEDHHLSNVISGQAIDVNVDCNTAMTPPPTQQQANDPSLAPILIQDDISPNCMAPGKSMGSGALLPSSTPTLGVLLTPPSSRNRKTGLPPPVFVEYMPRESPKDYRAVNNDGVGVNNPHNWAFGSMEPFGSSTQGGELNVHIGSSTSNQPPTAWAKTTAVTGAATSSSAPSTFLRQKERCLPPLPPRVPFSSSFGVFDNEGEHHSGRQLPQNVQAAGETSNMKRKREKAERNDFVLALPGSEPKKPRAKGGETSARLLPSPSPPMPEPEIVSYQSLLNATARALQMNGPPAGGRGRGRHPAPPSAAEPTNYLQGAPLPMERMMQGSAQPANPEGDGDAPGPSAPGADSDPAAGSSSKGFRWFFD